MVFLNRKNKVYKFFFAAALLYLAWYLTDEFIIKPYTLIDEKLVTLIISQASFILRLFGFNTFSTSEDKDMQLMGIDGSNAIWIGSPCNALSLFALFSIFVIAFPSHWKGKLWFIPLGIIIIHFANLFRVACLALINFYYPDWLSFNHNFTFLVFVYGIIFCLWMYWVNRTLKSLKSQNAKD